MDLLHSVILGVVQGLTEFLPISSSAHLVIVPWLFKWPDSGMIFDVSLHMGTAVAIALYFWRDWADILRRWREPMLTYLVIACLPAAAVGLLFEDIIEQSFRNPLTISLLMVAMGVFLFISDRSGKKTRSEKDIKLIDAVLVGVFQALALLPGVSRSGVTMTTGLFLGLSREASAKFSFLIATPIIFGAGVFKLRHLVSDGLPGEFVLPFITGVLVSAVVGLLAIKFLLEHLKKNTFDIFVIYRFVFAGIVLLVYLTR